MNFIFQHPWTPWIVFNLLILALLAIDLFVFHRRPRQPTLKEALGWSTFWILLALLFNGYIFFYKGAKPALDFLTGYLIEKSLSVDNLFVFLLIFNYFHTPRTSMHKVLFFGVLGAIIMRAIFIWLGLTLISYFHWIIYGFGLFLIYTGIKLSLEKEKKIDPNKNPIIKIARYFFPVTSNYVDNRFFIFDQSRYIATPLFLVLIAIETSDLIFAVDSIPAVLAITYDPFIVYTSNIFAILGLRSLYFVLSRLMVLFHYLHYAISIILVFVGLKMVFSNIFPISNFFALAFIFVTLLISILASTIFPQTKND